MDRSRDDQLLREAPGQAMPQADAWAQDLAKARSGEMPLMALLEAAQRPDVVTQPGKVRTLYETWLAHTRSPQRHVALFNHGTVLGGMGEHLAAEAAYREALQLAPAFLQAHLNLGHQLEHQGRHDEALASWDMVLKLFAQQGQGDLELPLHALNNTARLLEQLRRYDESEAAMKRSLLLQPDQPKVIQHLIHIRQKQCEWPVYAPVPGVTPCALQLGTSPLAMLGASDDPAMQLLAARTFVQERVKPVTTRLASPVRQRPGRLRLAFLSGDLCLHAVGLLTVELIELIDRSRFETFAYCWSRDDGSALQGRIRSSLDHHVPVAAMSDEAVARRIAADDIDVLIDLQGLTSGARADILSWRPARHQLTYLGFPGTTGLPAIDRVIADRFVMPPELLPYMTERPLYLTKCFQSSDRQRVASAVPTRAQCGLPDEGFVYCSFNNNFKMGQALFQSWMRVLAQVPGSVLWLLADNRWAEANMRAEASAHGVDPARLVFAPRVSPADYLARFAAADLILDTFPYNAGTTANDVLFMGVPILTHSGRTFVSRMAGSLLHAVGLPDLVTDSAEAYERMAITLGREPARVASYRRYLAEHRFQTPLFDTPALVRDLESQLEALVAGTLVEA
jgi:predicted O-linked N-acetylglucosamine transferase (SPINDLY family)